MWIENDELVGRRVAIYTCHDECEEATVLAVSDRTGNIRVLTDDGEILIGNQWDDL